MDFTRSASFFAAPFPSDTDGVGALANFPDRKVDLVQKALALIQRDARGFSTTGGVHFSLTGPIDASKLPDPAGSLSADSPVFLVALDTLQRTPAEITLMADGGPFAGANLLSVVPLQGFPLRPGTTYAAVVRRSLGLGVSLTMAQIAAGEGPAEYVSAARKLALGDLAGLAVFTTGDPAAQLAVVRDDALSRLPHPNGGFALTDTFDDYCVYGTTIDMPDYQSGVPPFTSSGGGWVFDAQGHPQLQRTETARLWVTIPRAPMPANGWPAAVFVRTGGGGDRPLVDRGPQPAEGQPATTPGTGPALWFAKAGWAGVQVDGPLGGLRNTTGGDEQFLIFNVQNPEALRDNIRESAVELIVLAHVVPSLALDTSGCPGAGASSKLDGSKLALMGHSMGATIAPLAAAHEPGFEALLLSGAGGSWIENVLYKLKPVEVLPVANLLIGYTNRTLQAGDPVLTLVQWAAEAGDPQVYAQRIAPRHVLMMQGIVDHYILPRIANSLSIPLGLDLAGAELDTAVTGQTPLSAMLPLAGRAPLALPAAGNASGSTAIVTQHAEDGIEDGHEVVFQTDGPK
ncbi:MAG TPA: hypothetical protein VLW85_05780, partial [Myxococcales bacterium]|nr:hypothetical protein [Myxococcales bacterium]